MTTIIPTKIPAGLPNRGNSCFVNSILQCLYTAFEPSNDLLPLERALRWRKEFFGNGHSQEDAHEFLLYTLDKLHRRNRRSVSIRFRTKVPSSNQLAWKDYIKNDYSFVIDFFHGQYIVSNVCNSCKKEYRSYEPFMGIDLPLLKQCRSVQDLINHESLPEEVSGYKCERPGCERGGGRGSGNGKVTQYRKINRYPQCLVVCLKRFQVNGRRIFKNDSLVGISKRIQFYNRSYKLVGICNHFGSLNGGHYTADVLRGNRQWYNCNDQSISRYATPKDNVDIQHAYILFYIKDR